MQDDRFSTSQMAHLHSTTGPQILAIRWEQLSQPCTHMRGDSNVQVMQQAALCEGSLPHWCSSCGATIRNGSHDGSCRAHCSPCRVKHPFQSDVSLFQQCTTIFDTIMEDPVGSSPFQLELLGKPLRTFAVTMSSPGPLS